IRDPVVTLSDLILDQTTKNDCGPARNGHSCRQTLAVNNGNLVPRDINVVSERVVNLGDLQGHLVVGVNQRNHFKTELHIFIADRCGNGGAAAVVNDTAGRSCRQIAQSALRDRHTLTAGDNSALVVRRVNSGSRENLEIAPAVKRSDKNRNSIRDLAVNRQPAQCGNRRRRKNLSWRSNDLTVAVDNPLRVQVSGSNTGVLGDLLERLGIIDSKLVILCELQLPDNR